MNRHQQTPVPEANQMKRVLGSQVHPIDSLEATAARRALSQAPPPSGCDGKPQRHHQTEDEKHNP